MNLKPCEISDCPALVAGRAMKCPTHRLAVLAKRVCVRKRCVSCRRAIRETDWVFREMVPIVNARKAGDPYGWRHVACEPPSPRLSKKKIKESEKPLLLAIPDDWAEAIDPAVSLTRGGEIKNE